MTIKHALLSYGLIAGILLPASPCLFAETPPRSYLTKGAPTFTQTLNQFEQSYNEQNPTDPLPPYIETTKLAQADSLYFFSKINNTLYSSAVIDSGTEKIKTLQITYVPLKSNSVPHEPAIENGQIAIVKQTAEETLLIDGSSLIINADESEKTALNYMINVFKWFNPELTEEACKTEVVRLWETGRDEPLYQEIGNNLRYVIVDHGEKGITLAVEPIKQPTPTTAAIN